MILTKRTVNGGRCIRDGRGLRLQNYQSMNPSNLANYAMPLSGRHRRGQCQRFQKRCRQQNPVASTSTVTVKFRPISTNNSIYNGTGARPATT